MESFRGKIAVVTGGGTGMGRELVHQLAKDGCHVAMCDVIQENLEESFALTSKEFPDVRITTHICDVSIEEDVIRFKNEVLEQHETDTINLYLITLGLEEEQVLLNLLERNGKSVSRCAGTVFITVLGNLFPILWPAKKDMS